MALIFTFLLIAGLEIAAADDEKPEKPQENETPELIEDPDFCVGCDDKNEEDQEKQQLKIEVRIDPETGAVEYIIKGIVIE